MPVRIAADAEPIPGYKLIDRLGGGGFGEVWKATAPGGLLKAIKFVYGELQASNEDAQRAEQELKALSRVKTVRHPYILSLERYDIIDNQLIVVMELADRNLFDRFKECRAEGKAGIPRQELLRYMEETAEALDLMNIEYQLQHLDIKPQNLFLVHNHCKVADFGLVKDLAGMMASLTGGVTPVYASPETFDGWVSRYCDQYSLAIVYQELLTGTRPFISNNVAQLIQQHLKSPPDLAPLPPMDREVIGRAMSKNPDDRFSSCMEMVRALRDGESIPLVAMRAAPSMFVDSLGRPIRKPEEGGIAESGTNGTADESLDRHAAEAAAREGSTGQTQWLQAQKDTDHVRDTAFGDQQQIFEGDGMLFPALIVGLGNLGLGVLKRLREKLVERFDTLDDLPTVRLLYIDTDPDGFHAATDGPPKEALTASEVILAKLNRPSYYLKSQSIKARVGNWLNQKLLYRIPRNMVTTGLRPLGRLAYVDNYRLIAKRMRTELEACTEREALLGTAQRTGLGIRTSRPRVYVVTALSGGTGSGMFIDVAYSVKKMLKEMGYEQPDIQGIFLLPAVDRHPGRTLGLANTFAALTELNHFSAPGTFFSAQYEEKDKGFHDHEGPFARCLILPLPEETEARSLREVSGTAADFLYRNLVTPLGRTIDEARAGTAAPPRHPWGLDCQTFGSYRISLPRKALLEQVGRHASLQLVQRWMKKDAAPIRDRIRQLIEESWAKQQFTPELLIEDFRKACDGALRQPCEAVLQGFTDQLGQIDGTDLGKVKAVVTGILAQVEEVLGRPHETMGAKESTLTQPLHQTAESLATKWGQRLAGHAVQLIENPEFRLAGAEEAIRQNLHLMEKVLQQQEPLHKEFTNRAAEARTRIFTLLENLETLTPTHKRTPGILSNIVELVRIYPKWRYQGLVLQTLAETYVSMRGYLSDQLREVNYCRDRLAELRRILESGQTDLHNGTESILSRSLFPEGCRSLGEASDLLKEAFTDADLQAFDGRMQQIIQSGFVSLVQICLSSANRLKELDLVMRRQAEEFLSHKIAGAEVAELFLALHTSREQTQSDVAGIFQQAAPKIAAPKKDSTEEIAAFAAPTSRAGSFLKDIVDDALADVKFVETESKEDIIFYRERPHVFLADLEHLGPLGYEAYRQAATAEHFTPHCRNDIKQWRAANAG